MAIAKVLLKAKVLNHRILNLIQNAEAPFGKEGISFSPSLHQGATHHQDRANGLIFTSWKMLMFNFLLGSLDMSNSLTYLNQTPIFDWYVVDSNSKNVNGKQKKNTKKTRVL
jgi:hypothetical protein